VAPDLPQRLAAILAADIAGYTRLMELDEAGTVAAWRLARAQIIDPTVARNGGRIVKLTGDGFLAEFSTVESAVRAGLAMQDELSAAFATQPADRRVAFRMGVDIGDIWVDDEDVYGTGVNVAARLEALATPGALCISDAVHAAVKHKIQAHYEDLGSRRVKNVATPVHVWRASRMPEPPPVRSWRAGLVRPAIAFAVLIAVVASVVYFGRPPATTAPTPTGPGDESTVAGRESPPALPGAELVVEPNTIAVLPLFNIDGTDEMRVFADGLAEDIINRLTATPPLRVSSRGDSFALGPNSPPQDVRNRLRVAYFIEGSVRRSGDTLRVVIQLIDSASNFHIVSREFDKPVREFLEIQDEVSKLVVANLRVALPSLAEEPVFVSAETASYDAYLAYRRGMDILGRPLTRAAVTEALRAFEESLAVDPGYAAAFAGICLANIAGYDTTQEPAYIDSAERSCGSALDRNANLIVVHDALGRFYLRTGRTGDAVRAFERALSINRNDVPALTGLGDAYLNLQRVAEAEQRYREAAGLQPGNWRTYNSLGRFLYTSGRYEEAAAAYREVVALDAANSTGWGNLASSAMLSGDFAAAVSAFERALDLEPSARIHMNLGMLHYYRGESAEARDALEQAIAMSPEDYLAWSNLGDVLTFGGDADGANRAFVEAERLARARLARNNRDYGTLIDLAWITAMLGRFADAQRLIAAALELAPTDPYVHYYDALVCARMGDTEDALDRLEKAVEMGYSRVLIRAEPHLAALRGSERFAAITD
jgi:class 3 adenylate cyclase/tetratricopeptide (TPR) repeat protein/TolB-like protein